MCKRTFELKLGFLEEWACKGTFRLKMGVWGGNGHAKRLLG